MSAVRALRSFHAVKERFRPACFAVDSTDASKFSYQYLPISCDRVKAKESPSVWNTRNWYSSLLPQTRFLGIQHYGYHSMRISNRSLQTNGSLTTLLHPWHALFPVYGNLMPFHREYSSHSGKNHDLLESSPASATGDSPIQNSTAGGNDWGDTFNGVYQSVVDAAIYTGKMVKQVSDEVVPSINQLLDSHPYLKDIVVPIGWTLSATVLAWLVLPRILRRFHYYASQTPIALLSGKTPQGPIPYEKSLWFSLEDPARYLITFVAFSQLGVMIAPTTSQYLSQAWRGALVLSVVWFLHRWKSNVFSLALANKTAMGLDRDKLLALDKLSSVGLIILGIMALAEACGIAVQSILTVGGIGGVATAFAARDILGNLLSGLSLQFSQPFSIGDNIKMKSFREGVGSFAEPSAIAGRNRIDGGYFFNPRHQYSDSPHNDGEVLQGTINVIGRLFRSMDERIDAMIEAGSIEGQVVEMGLTTTSLVNQEKLPVMVPNSLFSSQVIINKTRAQFRALVKTIPFCIDDLEKIPNVSENIKSMLKCHPAVVLEREAPYCFLSQIEDSYAELTIGCNLKNMRKEEWYSTEQDILLQATQIIKQHGAQLGGTLNGFTIRNGGTRSMPC